MIGERSNDSGSKVEGSKTFVDRDRRWGQVKSSMGTGQISMRPPLGTGQILAFASGGRFDGRGSASRPQSFSPFRSAFRVQNSACVSGGEQERLGLSAMGRIGVFQSCSCSSSSSSSFASPMSRTTTTTRTVSLSQPALIGNDQQSKPSTTTSTITRTIGEEAMSPN
jgi:hypothetical protein